MENLGKVRVGSIMTDEDRDFVLSTTKDFFKSRGGKGAFVWEILDFGASGSDVVIPNKT